MFVWQHSFFKIVNFAKPRTEGTWQIKKFGKFDSYGLNFAMGKIRKCTLVLRQKLAN